MLEAYAAYYRAPLRGAAGGPCSYLIVCVECLFLRTPSQPLTAVTSTTFSYAKTNANVTSAAVSPTGTADAVTRREFAGAGVDAGVGNVVGATGCAG